MKFDDFGKQLAKPVKFIKERSAFLPKPIQQIVIFTVVFAGLPVFLIGFLLLRMWEYKNVSLYNEYQDVANAEASHNHTDLKSLFFDNKEQEYDGYRDGHSGFGLYIGDHLVDLDEDH